MLPVSWITGGLILQCSTIVRSELIDLTYEFDNATHYWFAKDNFTLTEIFKGHVTREDIVANKVPSPGDAKAAQASGEDLYVELNGFSAVEHGGTHMDAPCHTQKGGWTIDQIPVNRMVAHAAVVDISDRATSDPDAMVTPEDLRQWKQKHGNFKNPTVVLVRTGYYSRWGDRAAYFGERPEEPGVRHFPGVGAEAAEVLAADSAVVGLGIDCASIDVGIDVTFPAHRILAPKNVYNLENVGDMSRLPASGAILMSFPMKIAGGSGAPCRLVAQIA